MKVRDLRLAFEQRVAQEPSTRGELEGLLRSVVRNEHGFEIASFLLNRYQKKQNPIVISQGLLEILVGNGNAAPEMLRLVPNHCEDKRVETGMRKILLVFTTRDEILIYNLHRDYMLTEDRHSFTLYGLVSAHGRMRHTALLLTLRPEKSIDALLDRNRWSSSLTRFVSIYRF